MEKGDGHCSDCMPRPLRLVVRVFSLLVGVIQSRNLWTVPDCHSAAIDGQLGQHQSTTSTGQPLLNDPRFALYEKVSDFGRAGMQFE